MLIDTYPYFRNMLMSARKLASEDNIVYALKKYLEKYSKIRELINQCYETLDWFNICLNTLANSIRNLENLDNAWENIYSTLPDAIVLFAKAFKNEVGDKDFVFVIYISCGCGAGWAAEYDGKPAVLLGLDMISNLGWVSREKVKGLIIHELCHLAHMIIRKTSYQHFSELEKNPYFLLYSEGFAMKCEHEILSSENWRIAPNKEWVNWCRKNLGFLARLYMEHAEKNKAVNVFYGTFFNIKGYSQTGYYLGHELIKYLEKEHSLNLRSIAKLPFSEIKVKVKNFLAEASLKDKRS